MTRCLLLAVAGLLVAFPACAQYAVELEGGYVVPGYNDVRIPGDDGTKLSLTDDLDADNTAAVRLRVGRTFATNHWVGLLAAPLTVKSSGTLREEVEFNGDTFRAGTKTDAEFRFDSYRLIYRYLVHRSDRWSVSVGGAAKVRDAAITLEGGGIESEKSNTGVVPLLSFNVTWTPAADWQVLLDGEALAAPQGRAEDVLLAAQYDLTPSLGLRAGYRMLEGGADNDEVYTFSLFHYATAGLVWRF